jgi:hypothetical protein
VLLYVAAASRASPSAAWCLVVVLTGWHEREHERDEEIAGGLIVREATRLDLERQAVGAEATMRVS